MIDLIQISRSLAGGLGLGAFFFLGLWWTVQRGVTSAQPALLFMGSMLMRTPVTVAGFYLLARGDWRNLVASLAGFLIARLLITRRLGSPSSPKSPLAVGEAR